MRLSEASVRKLPYKPARDDNEGATDPLIGVVKTLDYRECDELGFERLDCAISFKELLA